MSVDAKVMTVVSAIRQSLQTSAGPGSAVNSHPNPFFLNVSGEMNLKHAAELIIQRLEEYEAAIKAKVEKLVKEAEVKFAPSVPSTVTVGDTVPVDTTGPGNDIKTSVT